MTSDNKHTIKLIIPLDPNEARLEMDGEPLNGVSRIDLSVVASHLTQVRLTMYADVVVEGELKETEILHIEK